LIRKVFRRWHGGCFVLVKSFVADRSNAEVQSGCAAPAGRQRVDRTSGTGRGAAGAPGRWAVRPGDDRRASGTGTARSECGQLWKEVNGPEQFCFVSWFPPEPLWFALGAAHQLPPLAALLFFYILLMPALLRSAPPGAAPPAPAGVWNRASAAENSRRS